MRGFHVSQAVRARAERERRRRAKERDRSEALGAVVVMPPMDPPPTPPDHDMAAEGTRAVLEARDNQLAALMAAWRAAPR